MSKILYINDLARELGTTTDAIRGHIQRKSDAIPPFFKRGRRICWSREAVDAWIKKMDCKGRKALGL